MISSVWCNHRVQVTTKVIADKLCYNTQEAWTSTARHQYHFFVLVHV